MCWLLNDVSVWLHNKSAEEQDRLIRLVSSVAFRKVVMQQDKERRDAEKEQRNQRQDKAIAAGKQLEANNASILHNQDMWEKNIVEQRISHLVGRGNKPAKGLQQKMLRSQYVHVEAWYKAARKTFPFSKQPSGSKHETWLEAFKLLHNDSTYMAVLKFKSEAGDGDETLNILQEVECTPKENQGEIMDEETLC